MNLVALAISFTISENYVLPSLLLLAESLSLSGLLSQTTSNYISILASVTFSPIVAFINGGQDETISQVYSSAVSYLGAVLG